ncbi:hypothetical protein KL935_003579 [Ogataea polymorpha]|nr:hypothetical protein KL937_003363 [Ogataea polymorpha]KAG7892012.1 hypothetical protein KL908_003617 [Ogataea polymorpha]KAG7899269.1 hypothetical protein KL935_003579 [Ogataea polymorpha]KAG7904485.1 hypothetical protein KL907_003361 [Ogataea polymorpha]KAG7934210.1 hypothetical protein KL904_003544 [Ogataea polymorpha]
MYSTRTLQPSMPSDSRPHHCCGFAAEHTSAVVDNMVAAGSMAAVGSMVAAGHTSVAAAAADNTCVAADSTADLRKTCLFPAWSAQRNLEAVRYM